MCRLLRLMIATPLAMLADAIMPPQGPTGSPQAPPLQPPEVSVADTAEQWVHGLRWHHGPDEYCDFLDCYPCWLRSSEASDGT